MKLLSIINRRFIIASTVLLIVCSVVLFFIVRSVIYTDMKENLLDEKLQIENKFIKSGTLPSEQNLKSNRIEIKPLALNSQSQSGFIDTLIIDSLEGDLIPHRQLSFILRNQKQSFSISISHSLIESDDLILTIVVFTLLFILMLFVALYVVNRNFSRRIWFPFNTTLEKLKSLNLTDRQEIQFSKTGINEFDELNSSLEKMTARLKDEFNKVKQFTENASHEIQTPLSIIRSKIETLIQTENISEVQMNSIQQINDAVTRLSRLNNALITLTKIENHQFGGAEEILLNKFIQNKLLLFEDVLQQKNISVTTNIDTEMKIKMNTSLADLLFENLISNAIKHNIDGGFINISFLENQFSISNSGNPLNVSPDLLFNRFVKNNPASDSLGLGLAMVKQICASYNFDVSFSSAENLHSIKITF